MLHKSTGGRNTNMEGGAQYRFEEGEQNHGTQGKSNDEIFQAAQSRSFEPRFFITGFPMT